MKTLKAILSYVATLDGWLSAHEGYFLYRSAQQATRGQIVEIGSWKGKSTICLAAGSKSKHNAKVTAIDPHKGEYSRGKGIGKDAPTYKEFLKNLSHAGVKDAVQAIVSTSEDAAKTWKKPISLLFIDGLHDYKHTKQDFSLWQKYVQEGGVIAFHDAFCGHDGPRRVILEDILPHSNYSDFGVVGSIIYARKQPAKNVFEKLNKWRNSVCIRWALAIHKKYPQGPVSFFMIHRLIKLLLLNKYTYQLFFEEI